MTMLGNLDNARLHLKPYFKTHVIAMHDRLIQREVPGSEVEVYGAQVRKDMCFSTRVASGLMGQYWALASQTGEVWDCILKIFKGEFSTGRGLPVHNSVPRSVSHFTKLGNLPPRFIAAFLKKVIANEWSFATMNTKIMEYKTAQRIKAQSAQAMFAAGTLAACAIPTKGGKRVTLSIQQNIDIWAKHWNAHVPKKCPALGAQWMSTWAAKLSKGKMKDALPEQYLERMFELWDAADKETSSKVLSVFF